MSDEKILHRRAARLAKPIKVEADDGTPALLVRINEQHYAFLLADVRRAAVVTMVTPLPHVPAVVLGLGILDGEVHAIFDSRIWSGGARRTQLERIAVLILGPSESPLALAVDSLAGSTVLPPRLQRSANAPPWLLGLTDDGVFAVRIAALLADPMFTSGNHPIQGAVDDHHEED